MAGKKERKEEGREPREGCALLSAPDGVTGASVDGVEYQADGEGVVEVAAEHAAALVERGFVAL